MSIRDKVYSRMQRGNDLQTQHGSELSLYHPTDRVLIYPTYKQVRHANESGFHVMAGARSCAHADEVCKPVNL